MCSASRAACLSSFRAMQPGQRYLVARAHGFCTNCLALSHQRKECSSAATCRVCGLLHHTLLHRSSIRSKPPKQRPVGNHRTQPPKHRHGGRKRMQPPRQRRPTSSRKKSPQSTTHAVNGNATKFLVQNAIRTLKRVQSSLVA